MFGWRGEIASQLSSLSDPIGAIVEILGDERNKNVEIGNVLGVVPEIISYLESKLRLDQKDRSILQTQILKK